MLKTQSTIITAIRVLHIFVWNENVFCQFQTLFVLHLSFHLCRERRSMRYSRRNSIIILYQSVFRSHRVRFSENCQFSLRISEKPCFGKPWACILSNQRKGRNCFLYRLIEKGSFFGRQESNRNVLEVQEQLLQASSNRVFESKVNSSINISSYCWNKWTQPASNCTENKINNQF